MAKGYLDKIEDILEKMSSHTDKVIDVLHQADSIVRKLPAELTDADVEKLQSVIIQAMAVLYDYNGKLYGT